MHPAPLAATTYRRGRWPRHGRASNLRAVGGGASRGTTFHSASVPDLFQDHANSVLKYKHEGATVINIASDSFYSAILSEEDLP